MCTYRKEILINALGKWTMGQHHISGLENYPKLSKINWGSSGCGSISTLCKLQSKGFTVRFGAQAVHRVLLPATFWTLWECSMWMCLHRWYLNSSGEKVRVYAFHQAYLTPWEVWPTTLESTKILRSFRNSFSSLGCELFFNFERLYHTWLSEVIPGKISTK